MRLIFGDMTKELNVFNLGKHPYDINDQPFKVNFIENMTSEHNEEITLESKEEEELESSDLNLDEIEWATNSSSIEMENLSLTPPPIEPPPSLELKTLPKHLKYAYLSEQETLSVIVASNLTNRQEEDLLATLRRHREVIGWTMADIKGLSPNIVQHRIHLEEGVKPKRDPQRRLNPLMQEAVQAEIMKLLDNGIIYLISDSEWVSSVHVVPKKSSFIVVENDKQELG